MVMIIIPVTNRNLSIWLLLSLLTDLWSNKNRSCYKSWVVEQKLKISIKIVGSGVGEKRNGCQGLTESFPSSVRFRLRRHPNRVRLTRSNVIRRNTPSLLSLSLSFLPLLSLVLVATLAVFVPSWTLLPSYRGPRRIHQQLAQPAKRASTR